MHASKSYYKDILNCPIGQQDAVCCGLHNGQVYFTEIKTFISLQKRNSLLKNLLHLLLSLKQDYSYGSGCDTVGRVVTSNTRGLQFKSGHLQNLY